MIVGGTHLRKTKGLPFERNFKCKCYFELEFEILKVFAKIDFDSICLLKYGLQDCYSWTKLVMNLIFSKQKKIISITDFNIEIPPSLKAVNLKWSEVISVSVNGCGNGGEYFLD